MHPVLIRRYGTLIDISADGINPVDAGIFAVLSDKLSYWHKRLLRGAGRYNPDGSNNNMDIELKYMYTVEGPFMVMGFGFLTTVLELLQGLGTQPRYIDISEVKRPDTYDMDWDAVHRNITFRPGQEPCLHQIAENECGLINAPTAFGKTHMMEAVCYLYPNAKIDIIVRPRGVAGRIVRQLTAKFPSVGQVGGGEKRYGSRITVYTAGSAHLSRGDADILLCDEAHQLMTQTTATDIATGWRASRNFGFTATPDGRLDGGDAQLEAFFGREIFRMTYQEAVDLGLIVPIHVRWLPILLSHNPAENKQNISKERWGIWRNHERNALIARDVRERYPDPNTQILILTDKTEHAIMLWQYLPEFSLCYGTLNNDKIERYKRSRLLPEAFSPVTPAKRDEMRVAFEEGRLKRVIATDVWATGVDFQALQVLYRVDGRSSKIMATQAPGRVSRIHPESNKQFGEVIDCADFFDPTFRRKSEARRRHYSKLKWSQEWPKVRI